MNVSDSSLSNSTSFNSTPSNSTPSNSSQNCQNQNCTNQSNNSFPSGPQWQKVQLIGDTNNGTYPLRAYSLFGYSVSMTKDGAWLAVGIPGRTNLPLTTKYLLQNHQYSGSVRIFRRVNDSGSGASSSGAAYLFIGEIVNPNPNPTTQWWDKFGAEVSFHTTFASSPLPPRTFLTVVANAGWDGASDPHFGLSPGNPTWPASPETDVSRAGVYVYELTDYFFNTTATTTATIQSLFNFTQFIRQESAVPLGTVGIKVSLFDLPTTSPPDTSSNLNASNATQNNSVQFTMFVRDFVILQQQLSTDLFQQNCPQLDCSYVRVNSSNQSVNATGIVSIYTMNVTSGLFQPSTSSRPTTQTSTSNPLPLSSLNVNTSPYVAVNVTSGGWAREEWFGASIDVAFDALYNRVVVAVGAPRDASLLYSFFQPNTSRVNSTWLAGQCVGNPHYDRRSFFGGTVALSPDASFLLVSDAVGASSQQGRGQVFLHHRRTTSQRLLPDYLNQVVRPPLPDQSLYNFPLSPYAYDLLFEFVEPFSSTNNASSNSTLTTNHFGFAVVVNQFWTVVAAPVEQCVYSYALPLLINVPPAAAPPPPPPSYTIPPLVSTPTPKSLNPSTVASSVNQGWLYGLIAGIVALLCIFPLVWYLAMRRHKQRLLQQLKANTFATAASLATVCASSTILASASTVVDESVYASTAVILPTTTPTPQLNPSTPQIVDSVDAFD